MTRKTTAIIMALILAASCLAGCNDNKPSADDTSETNASSQTSENSQNDSSEVSAEASDTSGSIQYLRTNWDKDSYFSDGDTKDIAAESADAEITLSGNSGTISDTTRGSSGSEVTITSKGIYRITGSSDGVSIVVNDETESGNIYLILDNVTMTNSSTACISVQSADKVILVLTGENSLSYTNTNDSEKIDGAVYAKDDLTINGTSGGKLKITSSLHGIVCKDDLKIIGGECDISSGSIGIKLQDGFLRLKDCTLSVQSGHDGIKLSAEDKECSFYSDGAIINVTSQYDGISITNGDSSDFTNLAEIFGGSITITAGGGSDNSKNSKTSQKGIKCKGEIHICDCDLKISSADDALHNKGNMLILGGSTEISSSDDGITSDSDLVIEEGTITVSKSYEAIEAANVTINSGDIKLYSSDDGINCAGGSDTGSSDSDDQWNNSGTDAKLTINGGNVYVNSSGDGLDSNGSIFVTGGTVIIEGPTRDDNGAIDKGDGDDCTASITGGTVLATGSSGMAVNFDSGTQCSALVQLSGSSGTEISVDDGSGFTFTSSKDFSCIVYSSPNMTKGNTYTIKAGDSSATADFTS